MSTTKDYELIKPYERQTVFELLEQAGFDLKDWGESKYGASRAAANPKYCYNWSFEEPGQAIAVCIWYAEIMDDGRVLYHSNNMRVEPVSNNLTSARIWKRRAVAVDKHIRAAYIDQLPIRALVLMGERRDRADPTSKASRVRSRLLDPTAWAVTEYDIETGDFVLTRGADPVVPFTSSVDAEAAAFKEGALRRSFRKHRHREWRARRDKIGEVMRTRGRLICEVSNCGFDFEQQYGELGAGYAHVHHLTPLSAASPRGTETKLSDLAIVCANCHSMIYLGGQCRPLESLIVARNLEAIQS